MSKAFTKEDDDTAVIRLDDLPHSRHPNLVTASGLAALNQRLEQCQSDLGALRCQTGNIDTRHAIAVAERDIRYLQARIGSAILVDPETQVPGVVAFGAKVDFITDDDTRHTFRIVGEDEADPARGLISSYSPLGIALMGARTGSTVEWRRPAGSVDIEVLAIRFPRATPAK